MAHEIEPETEIEEVMPAISVPTLWVRLPCGIRVEDLQENRYEEAAQLVKHNFNNEDVVHKGVNILEDKESTDEFTYLCRCWVREQTSLGAVKEGDDQLIGVAIMRTQDINPTVNEHEPYSERYIKIVKFLDEVQQPICIFEKLDVKKYLKIVLVALLPQYRHMGIAKELMKVAIQLSENANIPAIAGIFPTARSQLTATHLDFIKYNEIHYNDYAEYGKIVFTNPGLDNISAALMAYRIPGVEEPTDGEE